MFYFFVLMYWCLIFKKSTKIALPSISRSHYKVIKPCWYVTNKSTIQSIFGSVCTMKYMKIKKVRELNIYRHLRQTGNSDDSDKFVPDGQTDKDGHCDTLSSWRRQKSQVDPCFTKCKTIKIWGLFRPRNL